MKSLNLMVVIACWWIFVGATCHKDDPQPVKVEVTVKNDQPSQQQQQPGPEIQPRPERYHKGEIIPNQLAPDSRAEEDHKVKIDQSQDATRIVPEVKKDIEVKTVNPETGAPQLVNKETGQPTGEFYLRVEAKLFDDQDILKQVRQTIIDCAQNKNYRFEEEEGSGQLGRRGFAFKLWSELPGPISLTQTLEAALQEYIGRIRLSRKDERYILITQDR